MSTKSVWDQVGDLSREAAVIEGQLESIRRKMRDLLTSENGHVVSAPVAQLGTPTTPDRKPGRKPAKNQVTATPPKRRGRPPGSGKKNTPVLAESSRETSPEVQQPATPPKRRGRPPGSKKKNTPVLAESGMETSPEVQQPATPPKRRGRLSNDTVQVTDDQDFSQKVWEAFCLSPDKIRAILPDYPTDASGLNMGEVRSVMEGMWPEAAKVKNITQKIQDVVAALREHNKLKRGSEYRYVRGEGAELDGPPLPPEGENAAA